MMVASWLSSLTAMTVTFTYEIAIFQGMCRRCQIHYTCTEWQLNASIFIEIRSWECFLSTERDLFDAGCFYIHPAPEKFIQILRGLPTTVQAFG